jgi:23S rRNA pseudouridine1911/1915/1917 synthase
MEFFSEYTITERQSRQRIDRFLSQRFGYLSRTEWQKEIMRGKVLYNGAVLLSLDKRINAGDIIAYTGRDAEEPPVDANYSIIYEDDHLLGINKPGNLPVHPAGVFYHNTLLSLLQKQYREKLHLLHRLDRETSGVVVLAKDAAVATQVYTNFKEVEKTYLALVHGVPEEDDFVVDIPMEFDTGSAVEHMRIARDGAREKAVTRFSRLQALGGYCLMKARPFTGRQHQIRVHLKHAGHPIVGDKMYGVQEPSRRGPLNRSGGTAIIHSAGFGRSALHSRSLIMYHPVLRKKISIKAHLPADMRQFITSGLCGDV